MKAVLLAAGKGTRLGAMTATTPKPLLPVRGRPIIAHLLDRLAGAGVTDVFVNLHHHADAIRQSCGSGDAFGLRIEYVVEPALRGTAGALRNFAPMLDGESFLVAYGDNFLDCDVSALWKFHAGVDAVATLALFEKDDVSGSGIAALDEAGRIVRFVEKPAPAEHFSHLVNGGLYVLSPRILSLLPVSEPCDFSYDVFPALLAAGHPLYGRVMDGAVWGIDTPELYRALRRRMGEEA
jgi:mannose-1-phosphate guanylyltransferase / phosphomannomutase